MCCLRLPGWRGPATIADDVTEPLTIDGTEGEGGGQILRTSLALSIATSRPVRLVRIRAGRKRPGLLPQHLACVRAAARVSGARVVGAELGSDALEFEPQAPVAGTYEFSVGTAGSACLVLQTVLPPLMLASGPSNLVLEGGTHNSMAPPFEFIERVFAPLLGRLGVNVQLKLDRYGFYPAGGGRFTARIRPGDAPGPLVLLDGGAVVEHQAHALVANLPMHIADRELAVVRRKLGWCHAECRAQTVESPGPGNVVMLEVKREQTTELFTGFGARGVRAEKVAAMACDAAVRYVSNTAPVGPHLADQMIVPMALAGGGAFRTTALTGHTRTNIETVHRFLPRAVSVETTEGADVIVRVQGCAGKS